MEDKIRTRIFVLLSLVVMLSVLLVLFIGMILVLTFIVQIYDIWFWLLISTCVVMCLFDIWGIILTCQYVDIDFNEIKLVSYKGIFSFGISAIELVEIRKSAIGHLNIIVKTKEPIQLVKRNKNRNKFMQEFGFIHSAKLVGIFKRYLPKEIPWIYNDYFKNPNMEPKKPKKK